MYTLTTLGTPDRVSTFTAAQVDDALLAFHDASTGAGDVTLDWTGDEPCRVATFNAFDMSTTMDADEHFRLSWLLRQRRESAREAMRALAI